MPETPTPKKLTPTQIKDWNEFIDFIDSKGYKGSTDFDKKDTNLGKQALEAYKRIKPEFSIAYEDIPSVQQGILDVRNYWISNLKSGKSSLKEGVDAGKDYERFMPNTSPVDGWLGSKTSSHRFPKAYLDEYVNGEQVTNKKDLGFVVANKP